MSTSKDDDFDYQAYVRNNPPDITKMQWGTEARKQRFAAAVMRQAVRIDKDVLEQFQELVPEGQRCERLINQALREWLYARGMKELVREELQQAFLSMQAEAELAKPEVH